MRNADKPHANVSKVVGCLREAADGAVTRSAEDAGFLASAGMVTGAFYDSLRFCAIAIDSARSDGRLGRLPRLLATQAILAVRLPNWDIAIPAAEEARRLATQELEAQPIWLATAEDGRRDDRGPPRRRRRGGACDSPCREDRAASRRPPSHRQRLPSPGRRYSALARGRYAEALRLTERLFDPRDPAHHLHFACMAIGDLAEAAVHSRQRAETARERLAEVEAMVGSAPAEWVAITLRHARAVLADDEREAAVPLRRGPQRGSRSLAFMAWPPSARPRPVAAHGAGRRRGLAGTAA